jgi:AraC-like DNA-binding protein
MSVASASHSSHIAGYGPLLQDGLEARVLQTRKLQIDAKWRHRGVRSSFSRLYVNRSAGATLTGPWGRLDIAPDRLVIVPAWVTFNCKAETAVDHLYVHFDMVGATQDWTTRHLPQPIALPLDSAMSELTARLRDGLSKDAYDLKRPAALAWAKALILTAMGDVLDTLPDAATREVLGMTAAHRAVEPALIRIRSAIGEPLPVPDLAGLCRMSVSQFIRRFKSATGQTPANHIRKRRLAEAAQRLTRTDESLDSIAQSLGFSDRFHLTKAFTQSWGIPPATYRKQQQGEYI